MCQSWPTYGKITRNIKLIIHMLYKRIGNIHEITSTRSHSAKLDKKLDLFSSNYMSLSLLKILYKSWIDYL